MDHQINRTRRKRLGFNRPKERITRASSHSYYQTEDTQKCYFVPKATKLSSRAFTLKDSAPLICQDVLALLVIIPSLFIYLFLIPFWWLKANRNGMTGCDDLQRLHSRPKDWEAPFPNCVCSQNPATAPGEGSAFLLMSLEPAVNITFARDIQ